MQRCDRWLLPLAAGALALLVWLPLGLAGVPLDTPDGFLHLGWAAGWARQVAGGWWWPCIAVRTRRILS